jgi:type I restriction enzyme S subunit
VNPPKSEVADLPDETEVSFLPMEAIGERGELDLSRTRSLGEVRTGYSYLTEGDVVDFR